MRDDYQLERVHRFEVEGGTGVRVLLIHVIPETLVLILVEISFKICWS